MSASGKQSFYEIQLSNSSLIVAFVIAVGLGVAVFMLGVMVGRGQAPQPVDEQGWVESLGADGGEPAAGAVEEEEPAEDLDFYERVEDPVDGQETADAGDSGGPGAAAADDEADADEAEAQGGGDADASSGETADLPAADPSIATGFVVQVKATPNRADADALQAALAAAGYPAFVVQADVGGNTTYRVRVGRYGSRDDAERVSAALEGRSDVESTWVTEG